MSKILEASCSALGIVTSEGVPVPAAEVMSEGNQTSTGLLFLEGETAKYLPSSATDIKALIQNMVSILNSTITILTGLDAVTVSPGTQAANIAALTALKVQLDATKDLLK